MRKLLKVSFVFLICFFAFSKAEDLLASLESLEKRKFHLANQTIGMFYDRMYSMAIEYGEKYLKIASAEDEHFEKVIDVLYLSYYYTENPDKLYKILEKGFIKDRDLIMKGLVLLSKKNRKEYVNHILRKYGIEDTKNKKYKKIEGFELGKNIFEINSSNVFGENEIYISEKNQTLLEIARKTDTGFYELHLINDILNPFDIKKGQIVIIPRRRIIPEFFFEFGVIYINLQEKRLYYPVVWNKKQYIITFPVGVGVDDAVEPIGEFEITEKRKHPAWYPPESIRKKNPELPKVVPPGKNNPLGTRAMRLGYTTYLIHGTNKPYGIGMKVSHGCIRMYNEDVEKLFEIVDIGTVVRVVKKSVKVGKRESKDYIEIDTEKRLDVEVLKAEIERYSFKEYPDFYMKVKSTIRGTAVPLE